MKKSIPYENVPKLKDFQALLDYTALTWPLEKAFAFEEKIARSSAASINATSSITFTEFRRRVLATAANLVAKKYHHEHIALIGNNSLDWLILFFAIVLSGNTVVIIDKAETPEKISAMLKTADCHHVFHSVPLDFINEKNLTLTPFSEILNSSTPHAKATPQPSETKQDKTDTHPLPTTDPDATAVIFFTSGTSGMNKAVMLSQKNICSDIYAASSIYRPLGSTVSFLPFHHAFGLVTAVLMPFYYGKTTYLTSSLKNIASDLKNNSPHTIFAVPAVIEMFYRQIWREARKSGREKTLKRAVKLNQNAQKIGLDLSSKLFKSIHNSFGGELKVIICGGAYLDPKYIKWFRAIGIQILNGYGITECSPVVSVNRVKLHNDNSVGQLCRDIEVKTAPDGELLVKGDIIMKGYYGDRLATHRAIDHRGWLHTGDFGHLDKAGFLHITGRKKDLIILSNGENISPESIEAEFLHDEAVRECLVYSKANQIVAEIYPTEDYLGDQAYFDTLLATYNKGKPRHRQVAFVHLRSDPFPKNNNTKILRHNIL